MSSNGLYSIQNINYTGDLIRPSTTKGTVITNNGTDKFEQVTPTTDGQILTSDSSQAAGTAWSTAAQGLAVGFGIGNGVTPDVGNTTYFLTLSSPLYVPAIPIPNGVILFFSVRPDNGINVNSGWSDAPGNITGGTLDYTFGYLDVAESPNPVTNFTAYAGGPHYQIQGTDINDPTKDYATFYTSLNILATTTGQQLAIKLDNNLTVSAPVTHWSDQNAFVVLRF